MAKCIKAMTRGKSRYLDPAHRRKALGWSIKRVFGISLWEYELRKKCQGPLCAICLEPMDGEHNSGREPTLDHNHKTGEIREFLHATCNKAIGLMGDDPVKLRQAATYLEKHNE